MNASDPLPADVVDAIDEGRKIEAIKRLRERTGLGLAEAKDAVEGYMRDQSTPSDGAESGLPDDVVDAIQQGRYVEAVKRIRVHRNLRLKEAKAAVDEYRSMYPPPPPPIEPRAHGLGLSLLVLVLLVLGYLAYFYLSG